MYGQIALVCNFTVKYFMSTLNQLINQSINQSTNQSIKLKYFHFANKVCVTQMKKIILLLWQIGKNQLLFNQKKKIDEKDKCLWFSRTLTLINLQDLAKKLDFAKSTERTSEFFKLQEAIWLPAINEIFKIPPHLDSFYQINVLFELS